MKVDKRHPIQEILRRNLIKQHEKVGGSHTEFAKKLGVSKQFWSLLKTGKCTTRLVEVERFAKALGVTTTDLLTLS